MGRAPTRPSSFRGLGTRAGSRYPPVVSSGLPAISEVARALAERHGITPFASGAVSAEARAFVAQVLSTRPDAAPDDVLGSTYEGRLDAGVRRARGTHFTPREITHRVVSRALDVLAAHRVIDDAVRVLDPAMGAGAFLCEALRQMVARRGLPDTPASRRRVALACLHGVDKDAAAVEAARFSVWLTIGDPTLDPAELSSRFVVGDALFERPFAERTFDLVLGNPPFLGGKRIRTVHGDAYAAALASLHPPANKNTDLAAHFLRHGFDRLTEGGVLAFVVTNTIAQGDTREGGLSEVLRRGGAIAAADRRVLWPGAAGVVVSLLWITRGAAGVAPLLDGRTVAGIDAFLSEHGRPRDPERRAPNRDRAFIGCFLRGKGFVFDDRSSDATALSVMHDIVARRPEANEVVLPFLGGEEVLNEPEQRPHRWVIHFGNRGLDEVRERFPELLAIVEEKVRPFREARRATLADRAHARAWWRFANIRPELEAAKRGLERVIVLPRMAGNVVAAFLPARFVFSDQLVVVASESPAVLALLSSRVHEVWVRLLASTLGDGLRYTPSDVFETFPLPAPTFEALEANEALRAAGSRFDDVRATVLRELGVGITGLLRRLEKGASHPALERFAEVKLALDRAVFEAYGWDDLAALALDGCVAADEILRRLFAESA